MPHINPKLFAAIGEKTNLSRAQVYARIQQVSREEFLPTSLAAIKLAASVGVAINRFASAEQLAELRNSGSPVTPPTVPFQADMVPRASKSKRSAPKNQRSQAKPPNQVFVVHGRDTAAKDSMFAFLRALGVKPIEWNAAIALSKKASPFVGEIISAAFAKARAIVVLLTPDDLAQLREDLVSKADQDFEKRLFGQARPNVIFECGMAFVSHPDRTVMVQLGRVRPFSDTAGRHIVHMSDDFAKRQELATKLQNAGCDVDTTGPDWVKAGDFSDPEIRRRKNKPTK